MDRDKAIKHVGLALENLGLDLGTEHLRLTPERFVDMVLSFRLGATFDFTTFPSLSCDAVVKPRIPFSGLCAHHLAPFFGEAKVGYIPRDRDAGLSKITRTVMQHGRIMGTQEEATAKIADFLVRNLTDDVAVTTKAIHTCEVCRGPMSGPDNVTIITALRGQYKVDSALRAEYLQTA